MVSVCLDCKVSLEIIHGDVLIRWDQHKKIGNYTRYVRGKLLRCVNCGYELVQVGSAEASESIKEENMVYHKDLASYRANWKIMDDEWKYP